MSVNSRIPPPFANRLSGASANSAGAGKSSPSPSLCGPQSSRYTNRVDPRRACGVAPALQSTTTKPPLLSLLCRRRSPSPRFSRSLSRVFSPLVLALAFTHARLPPARVLSFSLSLSLSLSCTRVLSLSLASLAPLACTLSLPLSLSRTRVLSPSLASLAPSRECSLLSFSLSLLSLPLASVLSLSLSLSRRSAGSAHFTCRAMSHAAYPVPPLRPFHRPSLRISSRPPRHVASLPGPAGYTPPLDGSR